MCGAGVCAHGRCVRAAGAAPRCACEPGHVGALCDVRVLLEPCASNPCRNNATCHDTALDFTCVCRDGWTGQCSRRTRLLDVHSLFSIFDNGISDCLQVKRAQCTWKKSTCVPRVLARTAVRVCGTASHGGARVLRVGEAPPAKRAWSRYLWLRRPHLRARVRRAALVFPAPRHRGGLASVVKAARARVAS